MSVTCVDAGEVVSQPCLRAEASHSYPPATGLPGQALFPWGVR